MNIIEKHLQKKSDLPEEIGIQLYEKGNITILEETVEDDWYAPKLLYHKTIRFRDNISGDTYSLKQTIHRNNQVSRPELKRFGGAAKIDTETNRGITTFGEEVFIESPGTHNKKSGTEKNIVSAKVTCRNCGGQHWTHSCQAPSLKRDVTKSKENSHYVPPIMRKDAEEQRVTVKISNIPEETDRDELKDMFKSCGRIYRVNVPRDKKTGEGRGFAFIDFNDKDGAIAAVVIMNGKRLGYQVISVEFALNKEGNNVAITIDSAATEKAKMQFSQAKAVEAKRVEVYQPTPRNASRSREPHNEPHSYHDDHERVSISLSRGSRVVEQKKTPRPADAEHLSNWRRTSKVATSNESSVTTGSTGWQPRTRSVGSNAFGSRRPVFPGKKPSLYKESERGSGWGNKSKR